MTPTMPASTPLTPGTTATAIRIRPVCESRLSIGQLCPRLAVAIEEVNPAATALDRRVATRCPAHAPPGAIRLCSVCGGENESRNPWKCGRCADDAGDER